ncbi:MAG: peptidoglycan-binding protein [Planctomycetaceae bacterium]|nr:peptidoglycan-binding protein [Planctomycetaceae bacterium]
MDLNGDGYQDILSGSYSRYEGGMAGLFQVLWGESGGRFKKAVALTGTDRQPLLVQTPRRDQPALTRLKEGDRGQLVGDLQRTLNDRLKLSPSLLTDGDFGPKTKKEVVKFQQQNKLPADGIVDKATWKALGSLVTQGEYLTEKICTRPTAVDWDADGDLDLVVGNFAGSFYLFKGTGKGKFQPAAELIKTDQNKPLKIAGAHSDPFVVDWDGDGDLDLLSGSSQGGVQWAENHGVAGQKRPVFKGFKTLIAMGKSVSTGSFLRETELLGPTRSTRIWVDDVNTDGKLDILVGDSVSLRSPARGLSEEESTRRMASWQKELNEALAKLRDKKLDKQAQQAASKRYTELYRQRSEFMTQQSTGFVWLYLQK